MMRYKLNKKYQQGGDIHQGTKLSDVILNQYKNLDFVKRISDHSLPPIKNPDGTTSSHSMAAEVDSAGRWYMLPTVVNKAGSLERLSSSDQAMEYGKKTGERIPMPNRELALWMSNKGYKSSDMAAGHFNDGGKLIKK